MSRRWIACDLGRFAIHTTRKRLLSITGVKPFIVQNLGKYERQLWQSAEFGEHAEQRVMAYRHFILDLYHARPITCYTWPLTQPIVLTQAFQPESLQPAVFGCYPDSPAGEMPV